MPSQQPILGIFESFLPSLNTQPHITDTRRPVYNLALITNYNKIIRYVTDAGYWLIHCLLC